MNAKTPYDILGDNGVKELASAFYDVMDELPEAASIRRMHVQDLADIKQKLYEYLSGWMGGPHLYHEKYNTICMTKPHSHYQIGERERDQWLMCMNRALDRIDASDELKAMLKEPVFNVAEAIRNTP
ncbi:globin [Endozoicomonas montiporae]|uniref:Globin n=2 Tax=Endozoicomonas montiporae TaxID=1027273 RepID=A0A081N5P6_9GAMM|nr:group II truncated hemoglobin [Endozoicomonas montiporae]AMO57338.1 globin [Endozoicomonas montiporae CL-33]KEQ13769.1 globin [Endozoicomonas montiporae]